MRGTGGESLGLRMSRVFDIERSRRVEGSLESATCDVAYSRGDWTAIRG